MKDALRFRDEDALRAAILAGLCPSEVWERPALLARDGRALVIAPDRPLPRDARRTLVAAGVEPAPLPPGARTVRCWAEALPATRAPVAPRPPLVVLATPAGLIDLAAELLRLGCERFELCPLGGGRGDRGEDEGGGGIVRAVDPPTYVLVRAEDREGGLTAYVPARRGDESVWIERGSAHPLASSLRAPGDHLLFVPRGDARWWQAPAGRWRPLDDALELVVARAAPRLEPTPMPPRRRVTLRLSHGRRRDAATLWVVRDGPLAAIDRLLAHLPDDVVARLRFAVGTAPGGEPIVLLRARPGRQAPPELSLSAETYAPLLGMNDVLAPAGATVEPPVSRGRLRDVVGASADDLVWLAPGPDGGLTVERIAERAFAPLLEWAEYVVHASAPALLPWIEAVELAFEPFVSSGREWADRPEPDARAPTGEDARRRRPLGGDGRGAEPIPRVEHHQAGPTPPRKLRRDEPAAPAIAVDRTIAELEQALLEMDAPADAPARLELLGSLGARYAEARRARDAGLCAVRVAWEDRDPAATRGWLQVQEHAARPAPAAEALLDRAAPDAGDVRLLAARVAAAPDRLADPHRAQRWLDLHDDLLDTRSIWLARLGMARRAGGDPLGLARARDRLLARLAGGLRLERELPSFLRFAGRGAAGSAAGTELGLALGRIATRALDGKRRRSAVEAPLALTRAYCQLLIAVGFARLGDSARARALAGEADVTLAPLADPVHGWLLRAYRTRIEQALDGLPAAAPLPAELLRELDTLERFARYKVDRLREASRILEPHAALDPIAAFALRQVDLLPELAAARALPGEARTGALTAILERLGELDDAVIARLDGLLAQLAELPEAAALHLLDLARPAIARTPGHRALALRARALAVAGHFGREDLVSELHAEMASELAEASAQPTEMSRWIGQSLRGLRRVGLRLQAAELLGAAERALAAARGTSGLRARLAVAAGLSYLGEIDRATAIFAAACEALDSPAVPPLERLQLGRDLALAYGEAPLPVAIGGIEWLANRLADVTDGASTNSHFCLSVLHLVESLVLGLASEDLALGEKGRRLIEDDEHLIRRRLHEDLARA